MDTIVSGTTNLYRLPVPHPRTITSTSSTIYSRTWLASLPFNKLSLHSRNRRKLGLSIRTSSSSVRNLPITCVTEIGESQFPDVVLKSDRPVLVEFVASWCGPCRLMASAIDSLAQVRKSISSSGYILSLPFNYVLASVDVMWNLKWKSDDKQCTLGICMEIYTHYWITDTFYLYNLLHFTEIFFLIDSLY